MRLRPARTLAPLTLAAFVVLAPVAVRAQDAEPAAVSTGAPGTVLHTVKRGDTLWDIAKAYLGDPFKWPDLFQKNTGTVNDPHWIYPGQRLVIGADGKPVFEAPPSREDAGAEAAAEPEAPVRFATFGPNARRAAGGAENLTLNGRAIRPTVRVGEVRAAPFLAPELVPSNSGTLVGRADATIIAPASSRDQFQFHDEVEVLLPPNTRGAIGQRYGVYRMGPKVKGTDSRLVVPTGVVELVGVGSGRAARASVIRMYQAMRKDDYLVPLDNVDVPETVRPEPVTNGALYDVAIVPGEVALPTIESYVVLSLPRASAGVKPGDQFQLFEPGHDLTGKGDRTPEYDVARIVIVHVGARSATGVVIDQAQPAIRAGMKARHVARMP
ncbi:MAG: LysM peptidoglycan-binding domain-containing protein [Gemmatimonadaceae bacterium]|jgi:hypothetical protein|nr:LysM peptidoglycan-binding domain-containing protein [Gemmatimonadaceae bacterium]